jgi:hypothetical protein
VLLEEIRRFESGGSESLPLHHYFCYLARASR